MHSVSSRLGFNPAGQVQIPLVREKPKLQTEQILSCLHYMQFISEHTTHLS
jgi:hypothetical protein